MKEKREQEFYFLREAHTTDFGYKKKRARAQLREVLVPAFRCFCKVGDHFNEKLVVNV